MDYLDLKLVEYRGHFLEARALRSASSALASFSIGLEKFKTSLQLKCKIRMVGTCGKRAGYIFILGNKRNPHKILKRLYIKFSESRFYSFWDQWKWTFMQS